MGVAEEVAPGVRRVLAPNPGLMTGDGTNTYLLGGDRLAVVDPGPDDDAHLAALLAATGGRVGWVLVTHTHTDHSPLARRLAAETGAEVLGFGPAPVLPEVHWHDDGAGADHGHQRDAHDAGFAPGRRLVDGDRLDLGGLDLVAVHTPGHCSNHLCFEVAGTGLVISGDHVMAGSTVVVAPPDGDMGDYLASLAVLQGRRPARIAPGHGPMIDDAGAVLAQYVAHRLDRERQVVAGLAEAGEGGTTAEALVPALYRDVPAALHPVARWSVWAHLRKLGADGRAVGDDPGDPRAPWRLASPG